MAQRISYSDKAQRRIEKLYKALDGTLEIRKAAPAKNENMQKAIETYLK